MSGGSSRRYPPELRERAVRMVAEVRVQPHLATFPSAAASAVGQRMAPRDGRPLHRLERDHVGRGLAGTYALGPGYPGCPCVYSPNVGPSDRGLAPWLSVADQLAGRAISRTSATQAGLCSIGHTGRRPTDLNYAQLLESMPFVEALVSRVGRLKIGRQLVVVTPAQCVDKQHRSVASTLVRAGRRPSAVSTSVDRLGETHPSEPSTRRRHPGRPEPPRRRPGRPSPPRRAQRRAQATTPRRHDWQPSPRFHGRTHCLRTPAPGGAETFR